jgi:hypothetical protein
MQLLEPNSIKNILLRNFTLEQVSRLQYISLICNRDNPKNNKTLIYSEWTNDQFNLPAADVKIIFDDDSSIVTQTSIDRLSVGDKFSKVIGVDEQTSVNYVIGSSGPNPAEKSSFVQKALFTIENFVSKSLVPANELKVKAEQTKKFTIALCKSVLIDSANIWKFSEMKDLVNAFCYFSIVT